MLLATLACPALAQKDAAEKVQEGNVNNWVEYYNKQREAQPGSGGTAAEEKEKARPGKEAREDAAKEAGERGR